MASSYFPSRAKAVPRAASAMASGAAGSTWTASRTGPNNQKAARTMSLDSLPILYQGARQCQRRGETEAPARVPGLPVGERAQDLFNRSEEEFQAELQRPRVIGVADLSEVGVGHARTRI